MNRMKTNHAGKMLLICRPCSFVSTVVVPFVQSGRENALYGRGIASRNVKWMTIKMRHGTMHQALAGCRTYKTHTLTCYRLFLNFPYTCLAFLFSFCVENIVCFPFQRAFFVIYGKVLRNLLFGHYLLLPLPKVRRETVGKLAEN